MSLPPLSQPPISQLPIAQPPISQLPISQSPRFDYAKHTKVLKLMKEKVPLVFLSINSLIANVLYSEYFINDTIRTIHPSEPNITSIYQYHPEKDIETLRNIFWVYYPILCCLCFGWEFFHIFCTYQLRHAHYNPCQRNQYAIWSSVMSVLTFIFISYYLNNGRPFSRIFSYNHMIAIVMFYVWSVVLWVYTHVEHLLHIKNHRNSHNQIVPLAIPHTGTY